MTKKNNNKKGKKKDPASLDETSSAPSLLEPSAPTSYAAAASVPPADDNEVVVDTSADATTAGATDPAPEDAVSSNEPARPSTPGIRPTDNPVTPDDCDAIGDSGSDFSRIKKDEISDAGSPGHVVEESGHDNEGLEENPKQDGGEDPVAIGGALELATAEEDASTEEAAAFDPVGGELSTLDPPAETMEDQGEGTAAGELTSESTSVAATSETQATEGDGPVESVDIIDSLFDGPCAHNSTAETVSELNSADDFRQSFGASDDEDAQTRDRDRAQEQSLPLNEDKIIQVHLAHVEALETCNVEVRQLRLERTRLQYELQQLQYENHQANQTLDDINERRNAAEAENRRLRAAQKALSQRVAAIEAERGVQDAATGGPDGHQPPTNDPEGPSGSPSDGGGGGDGDGGGPSERPSTPLDDEIGQLRAEIDKTQAELAAVRTELACLERRRLNAIQVRGQIEDCETEYEKLTRFGGAVDDESELKRLLLKLANWVDHGGAPLSANECGTLENFKSTLAKRKFAFAQAQLHKDPREFLQPHLLSWEQGEVIYGSTFRDRDMGLEQALDRLDVPAVTPATTRRALLS